VRRLATDIVETYGQDLDTLRAKASELPREEGSDVVQMEDHASGTGVDP
jgi:hypothetical protein